MTPKQRRDFETEWPGLAKKLDGFLAGKGVVAGRREDLIQETAVRLFRCWPSVDRSVPLGALACTIVLNLLRDEARRVTAHPIAELPDRATDYDLELAGIARIELDRVVDALASMGHAQRAVLLREVGEDLGERWVSPDAEKMTRLRARRKLALMIQRMSAAVSLRFFRLVELGGTLVPVKEGAFGALVCAACLFLGVGGSVIFTSPDAVATTVDRGPRRAAVLYVHQDALGEPSVRSLLAAVTPGSDGLGRRLESRSERAEGASKNLKEGGVSTDEGRVGATAVSGGATPEDGQSGTNGGAAEAAISSELTDDDASAAPGAPALPQVPSAPEGPSAPKAPPPPKIPPPPDAPGQGEAPPDLTEVTEDGISSVAVEGVAG